MKTVFLFIAALNAYNLVAQPTIGLMMNSPGATEGYTLFAPNRSNSTYLIDNCGHQVREWISNYLPGNSTYLLPNGELLRAGHVNNATFTIGGAGGIIEKYDWNGSLVWSFLYSDFNHCQHHDVHAMPNGNILAIAWVRKTLAQALDAGRNPNYINQRMFTEEVIEIDPATDSIVWRWSVWDHSVQDYDSVKSNYGVIADHPELVDINYFTVAPDVYHVNGIDYNPALDQIILSVHNYDEVWILDHSTTIAEAASHSGGRYGKGGDLLYRWGNPATYGAGTSADQQFFGQHNAQWIPDSLRYGGSLMVFNNGLGRPGTFSSIDIIEPPMDSAGYYQYVSGLPFGPALPSWSFTCNPPAAFYSPLISGVQPLEEGHYLICEGDNGILTEIDSTGDTLWQYVNPVDSAPRIQGQPPFNNSVFRSYRYAPGFPGFDGHVLTAGGLIEQNPLPDTCSFFTGLNNPETPSFAPDVFPNPAINQLTLRLPGWKKIELFLATGKRIKEFESDKEEIELDLSPYSPGLLILKITSAKEIHIRKILKL